MHARVNLIWFIALAGSLILIGVGAGADQLNEDRLAYIVTPSNGDTVSSPVKIIFGLRAPFGVAPAGVAMDNTGHHHLIIDTDLPALDQAIPKDEKHRHFGGGQTEATIELTPGEHTLQLLLGDFKHVPHTTPVFSEQITITVK
ncbi:MAG: DUF4399 domain-containing protein [Pseudomonadota bacterium]